MDDGTMYRPSYIHIHHGCPDIDWETVAHRVHGTLIQSKTYIVERVCMCVRACACMCLLFLGFTDILGMPACMCMPLC